MVRRGDIGCRFASCCLGVLMVLSSARPGSQADSHGRPGFDFRQVPADTALRSRADVADRAVLPLSENALNLRLREVADRTPVRYRRLDVFLGTHGSSSLFPGRWLLATGANGGSRRGPARLEAPGRTRRRPRMRPAAACPRPARTGVDSIGGLAESRHCAPGRRCSPGSRRQRPAEHERPSRQFRHQDPFGPAKRAPSHHLAVASRLVCSFAQSPFPG